MYDKIWQDINLGNKTRESNEVIDNNFTLIKNNFLSNTTLKTIDLSRISKDDKKYLKSSQIIIKFLKANRNIVTTHEIKSRFIKNLRYIITRPKVLLKFLLLWFKCKILLNKSDQEKIILNRVKKNCLKQNGKLAEDFKQILEDECICCVCPFSGIIIQTNHSIIPVSFPNLIFYRFSSIQTFYLVCGMQSEKLFLYFPQDDMIILLQDEISVLNHDFRAIKSLIEVIVDFKSTLVSFCKKYEKYLNNPEQEHPDIAILTNIGESTSHQITNFFAPIQEIYDNGYLVKFKKILITEENISYYGRLEEIFSEINSEQIKCTNLQDEIFENNLFVINCKYSLGYDYISDTLSKRIYEASRKKCSSLFLKEVEIARTNYFPLLWISFRTHTRVWTSQIDGISNIIENLHQIFPKLMVLFDGYTRTDIEGKLQLNPEQEKIIQKEQSVIDQIRIRVADNIPIQNLVGKPMHEVLMWSYNVDLHFSPIGSGMIKVLLSNKPGVFHSYSLSTEIFDIIRIRERITKQLSIPRKAMFNIDQENYDFDWKIAYDDLLMIASGIKR